MLLLFLESEEKMNSDKDIIRALKSNNYDIQNHAFEVLYNKYSRLIYVCINRYVQTKEDTEELTQDVFLKVYNSRDRLDETRNIKYYLTVTARNTALDFLKKKRLQYDNNEESINQFPDQEVQSNYLDIVASLEQYLSKEEIAIIMDKLICDYTFKEIADMRKMPIGTVMSKYSRAIKKFKKNYKGEIK